MIQCDCSEMHVADEKQTSGDVLASSTDRRALEPVRESVLYGYGGELQASRGNRTCKD